MKLRYAHYVVAYIQDDEEEEMEKKKEAEKLKLKLKLKTSEHMPASTAVEVSLLAIGSH